MIAFAVSYSYNKLMNICPNICKIPTPCVCMQQQNPSGFDPKIEDKRRKEYFFLFGGVSMDGS